ncbi:MAG: zf-HC2 domain-containing protein [Clostridia bacterium]|nr:zf-HC2 domain-containing protein [Clostridia bacterium]
MKHNCNIVRDLMPMCMDNTASEDSRRMVGEHVLECKPCMEMYQEMREEVLREAPAPREAQPFSRTVRRLRMKRRKRRIITGVIGALLGVLLFLLACSIFMHLTNDYAVMAEDKDYDFTLQRRSTGQIVATMVNHSGRRMDARWRYDQSTGVLQLYAVQPTWALKTDQEETPYLYIDLFWDDAGHRLMIRRQETNGVFTSHKVKQVYQGGKFKGNGYIYQVLYDQGWDIPVMADSADVGYVMPDAQQNGLLYFSVIRDSVQPQAFMTVTPMPTWTPQP